MYDDYDPYNECNFRDPDGRSALRKGKLIHPCPTCKRKNMLSAHDKKLGYQCDYCADSLEGCGFTGEY